MAYQSRAYYDQAYSRETLANGQPNHYRMDFRASPMYRTWQRVFDEVPENTRRIVDLGCGPGQFCAMAWETLRFDSFVGIDFSAEAIRLAREFSPQGYFELQSDMPEIEFICAELHGINYKAYPCDFYIACEVLEHLRDDWGLLEKLNSGTPIIITVPNHDDRGHVRYFETENHVRNHYYRRVNIEKVTFGGKHFLIKGTVK